MGDGNGGREGLGKGVGQYPKRTIIFTRVRPSSMDSSSLSARISFTALSSLMIRRGFSTWKGAEQERGGTEGQTERWTTEKIGLQQSCEEGGLVGGWVGGWVDAVFQSRKARGNQRRRGNPRIG
jgi:hypothetical protein